MRIIWPVLSGALLSFFGTELGCTWGQDVPLGGSPSAWGGGGAGGEAGVAPEFAFGNVRDVNELNSSVGDFNPTLSFDLLSICFTSLRSGGTGKEDIWCSRRASTMDDFDPPAEAEALNSALFETSSALAPDGLTIWFGSRREGGPGEVDVFVASRSSYQTPFGPVSLEDTLNSPFDDIPRPLGWGGRFMPLASRRLDGTYFTYLAEYHPETATFSSPELIAELAEASPSVVDAFLVADGLTLFFTREDPQLESSDLLFAQRPNVEASFGAPQPVAGINTEFDERDPWLSPDEELLYFSSDRGGDSDIYVAIRSQ